MHPVEQCRSRFPRTEVEIAELGVGLFAGGMNDPDVQGESGSLEVMAGGVGAVVDVQDIWDAVHRPRRVGLPPDRLPESEMTSAHRANCREVGVCRCMHTRRGMERTKQ